MEGMVNISEIFGSKVFDDATMRERLPKKIYAEFHESVDKGVEMYSHVAEIVANATENLVANPELADDISERFEVEEYEEAAGTFFIQYDARMWRDAAAFNAAIIGAAFAAGYFAEPSAKWEDGLDSENGCRYVSVFVAAADFMGEDGHAVA